MDSRCLSLLERLNDYELWKKFESVLALDIEKGKIIPENVKKLAKERDEARKAGNYQKSDSLRKEIEKLGFIVEDSKEGTKIS